eukprot:579380-Pelagomonas_calceolata.AAC.1
MQFLGLCVSWASWRGEVQVGWKEKRKHNSEKMMKRLLGWRIDAAKTESEHSMTKNASDVRAMQCSV